MRLLNPYKKVKAGSLLESVIAITVIGICITITMVVINNTLKSSYYAIDIKAHQTVKELWLDAQLANDYNNDAYTYDGFTIKKEVDYSLKSAATIVYYTVETNAKKKTFTYFVQQ